MKLKIMSIFFTLALILSACGAYQLGSVPLTGDVWVVQPGTTIYWIEASLQGATGTQIFQKGNDLLFTFPVSQGYGFTMMNAADNSARAVKDWAAATGGKANLANLPTMENFIKYMEENGWKSIPAANVAKNTAYGILKALTIVVGDLWTIIVLPVGVLPSMDCPPGYNTCTGWQ